MRKRIIQQAAPTKYASNPNWLDLETLTQIELTSEDTAFPVEGALIPGRESGWRASQSGEQTIRLLFTQPQRVSRIQLLFREDQQQRTQEFLLSWSSDGGQSYRDIVRQQFNFSPPGTTRQLEDYEVDLEGMTTLELRIIPDLRGGVARASLAQLRIA